MSNVLSEDKRQQVRALGQLGWSLRRIERETGVRRETAGAYLRSAGIAVRAAGWKHDCSAKPAIQVTTGSGAKPAIEVITGSDPADSTLEHSKQSICEPFRNVIELGLARGRNAMAIWQDLVADHGFTGSYPTVKRYARKLRGSQTPEPRVVIETAPGEEAQVDYGSGPMVRDPLSGKYRRTRLFVMTLGYSRKSVRLLVFAPAHASGPSCTNAPFADWVEPHVWWC